MQSLTANRLTGSASAARVPFALLPHSTSPRIAASKQVRSRSSALFGALRGRQ